jgi:hypothetical protein
MCPSPIRSPLQYLTATRLEATTLWKTPEFKNETSIWNPCVALLLLKLVVLPFHIYGSVGTEVLTLLEEIAEYVGEQQETNVAGLLCYYRREIACASLGRLTKSDGETVGGAARLDLVRDQHRYHWTNNVGMVNYIQEEGNDERQYRV